MRVLDFHSTKSVVSFWNVIAISLLHLTVGILALIWTPNTGATQYTSTNLGITQWGFARGINNIGQVVGYYNNAGGGISSFYGYP